MNPANINSEQEAFGAPSQSSATEGDLAYKNAGVDSDLADQLVRWIVDQPAPQSQSVFGTPLGQIGDFSGCFLPNLTSIKEPVLVATCDGVGTKLILADSEAELHNIGIDLVGMCANDLETIGATPLFFLDYFATGSLDQTKFQAVLGGIKEGLKQCQCALLGGETAEMPGLYRPEDFDLAGFMVGITPRQAILGQKRVQKGDLIFGLPSNGFHSNGFSLIRQWLKEAPIKSDLRENLLRPTHIYHKDISILKKHFANGIHALAHITGGGIEGNVSRIIPNHLSAEMNFDQVPTPKWMSDFILSHTDSLAEVRHTFNLGIGLILIADETCNMNSTYFELPSGIMPVKLGKIVARDREGMPAAKLLL